MWRTSATKAGRSSAAAGRVASGGFSMGAIGRTGPTPCARHTPIRGSGRGDRADRVSDDRSHRDLSGSWARTRRQTLAPRRPVHRDGTGAGGRTYRGCGSDGFTVSSRSEGSAAPRSCRGVQALAAHSLRRPGDRHADRFRRRRTWSGSSRNSCAKMRWTPWMCFEIWPDPTHR